MTDAGTVGFVGLGTMGMPMAKQLLATGMKVVAHDVNEAAMTALTNDGAICVKSPADVGAVAATVVCMLPDPATVEKVMLGDSGLITTMREGSLVVEMSTTGPEPTRRFAEALRPSGIRIIDAPVGRGREAAATGSLILMVGGDEADVNDARPVLEALGSNIYHCGPLGSGQTVKLINNLISTVNVAVIAEAYAIAVASETDIDQLAEVMSSTAADSWQLRNALVRRIGPMDFEPGFKVALAAKDLRLAIALADQLPTGHLVQASRAALDWYTAAASAGWSDKDQCAMLLLARDDAGDL